MERLKGTSGVGRVVVPSVQTKTSQVFVDESKKMILFYSQKAEI